MTGSAGCANRDTWQDLLDERLAGDRQTTLLAHLDQCPACAATVAELAGQWSLATLAREGCANDASQRASLETLRNRRPPLEAPAIPGIEGLELAGQGGMGAVFRGRDVRLGRSVAVKVLAGSALLSPSARARAEREARALAALDHPNVVRIHAAGEAAGLPYLVMEWIEGRTLQARIDAGVLPAREAATIALRLAEALAEVHAVGIIHRDLKPANVLLAVAASGEREVPKLVDFGLARPDDAGLTRTTTVLGTPSYMAPEQTGLDPTLGGVTVASDLHGLGGVLLCMLSGKAPYEATTAGESLRRASRGEAVSLAAAAPRTPPDLRTIVETCLRFEPSRRYATAAAVADDLARFLAHQPIAARPAGAVTRLRGLARRHPVAAMAAGSLALLAVTAGGGLAAHLVRLEQERTAATSARDAAVAAQAFARASLERLTDESIEALLMRGAALGEADRTFLESVRNELLRWPLEPDPLAGLAFRAGGLQRVADLLHRLQRLDDALECQDLVIASLEEIAARGGSDTTLVERRMSALARRSQLLYDLGRRDESLEASRALVESVERLADGSPRATARIAEALIALAIAEDSRSNGSAVAALAARGLDLYAEASRAAPDDRPLLEGGARALYNTALLSLHLGRHDERRERLERLVDWSDRGLTRLSEGSPTLAHSMLLGLTGLAAISLDEGDRDTALAIAQRRRGAAREAVERYPDNTVLQGERIDSGIQVAACHEAAGRLVEARTAVDEAVRLAESALEREPAVLDRALLLASALWHQAKVCERLGDRSAASMAGDRRRTVLMPWKSQPPVAAMIAEDGVSRVEPAR